MESNLTFPAMIRTSPFWNWTRIHVYDDNITKHDEHDDVTSIVIVCVGIAIMIVMWIAHVYSKEDRHMR
jgi:hypothetical protein